MRGASSSADTQGEGCVGQVDHHTPRSSIRIAAPLEHGVQIHIVNGSPGSIDDTPAYLQREHCYRLTFEATARRLYDDHFAPRTTRLAPHVPVGRRLVTIEIPYCEQPIFVIGFAALWNDRTRLRPCQARDPRSGRHMSPTSFMTCSATKKACRCVPAVQGTRRVTQLGTDAGCRPRGVLPRGTSMSRPRTRSTRAVPGDAAGSSTLCSTHAWRKSSAHCSRLRSSSTSSATAVASCTACRTC